MNAASSSNFVTRFALMLALSGMVGGCSKAAPKDAQRGTQGVKKVQATTIYVHDPLLSIPEAQRDHYEASNSFLRSGRALAAFIRERYPDKVIQVVHWPLNSAEEILSTNPEDYRNGQELRDEAIMIKVVGSTGSAPWVGRPTNGYAKLLANGDPNVLGASSLQLNEPEEGDVKCSDPRCSDPNQLIASVRGRVSRVIEGR